jgi:hypothetical protein
MGWFTVLKLQNSTLVVLSMTVQVAHSLFIEDGKGPFQGIFEFIRRKQSQHEKRSDIKDVKMQVITVEQT